MDKRSLIDLYGVRYPHLNDNPLYLAAQIERAYATVLAYAFRNNFSNYSLYTKDYSDIAVEQDTNGRYYSRVPVRLMQLPDDAESVRRITATQDPITIIFVPVPRDSWDSFALMDVDKVSTYVPYSVTNGRVEYAKKPPVTTVTMGLVRAFMNYDDSDEAPIPSGMETMFEQTLESFLNGTPPPNKLNV